MTQSPPTRAAIGADSPLTAAAGAEIAELGGNAVDIAVAAALAASVAEVLMCSLGGSAFFMVHPAGGQAELIDGADAMPHVPAPPEPNSDGWWTARIPYGDGIDVQAGHASIAVPGALAAAELTWRRHGSLPWQRIVEPSIRLAQSRIPVGPTLGQWLTMGGRPLFWKEPASRACLFRDGEPLKEGDTFEVPNLAHTMAVIGEEGADAFYRGALAEAFVREMQSGGGFVTLEDLAAYKAVVRKPMQLEASGFQLALNPPPAIGGAAVGFLIRTLERRWQDRASPAQRAVLHAAAQTRLLGLRETMLADHDVDDATARALLEVANGNEHPQLQSPNTTHLSVVTADGSMVAVTMSMGYGAGVTIGELGIPCNNGLGEPELNPQGFHAAPAGTRLRSNMAPSVAWHSDGRCLAFGSPGASRITTAIAQTWARAVLEGMSYEEAVTAPRLHIAHAGHSGDGSTDLIVQYEPGIDASAIDARFGRRPYAGPDMYFGAVKLAGLDRDGELHAVADRRREGAVRFVS